MIERIRVDCGGGCGKTAIIHVSYPMYWSIILSGDTFLCPVCAMAIGPATPEVRA